MFRTGLFACIGLVAVAGPIAAQTREQKVRADREKVVAEGFWIYNDLEKGLAKARETGKPLLVVLRCIPCEECVKLDEELMEQDPHLKPLLDKFIRVRLVAMNGLDLSLFQFDYDQSFAVFLLNADKTIYGRFGTRSHQTLWSLDVSIEGLAKAMSGALQMHAEFPKNKSALAAKQGSKPVYATPEKFPTLAEKYGSKLNYKGNVVRSCIHCHQIGDAQRQLYREQKKPIPETILFQYPHPKILGLILDPTEKATVQQVIENSPAESAGFRSGDEILTLEGQPLLSIADIQWVLHNAGKKTSLKAEVRRGDKTVDLKLSLAEGWRRRDDLSWRVTSWPLRRMVTGGLVLAELTAEQRADSDLSDKDTMALLVKHVGQYGPHAAAKKAGFRKGDIIVSYDGRTNLKRETDVIVYAITARKPGDRVPVIVLRGKRRLTLMLPMQQ
ncbi:MAG: PDZ domain-containing protein [Planctomycetes bacterium]|nr:PDZ domain-containing protein [Planctomycetota bacterium]